MAATGRLITLCISVKIRFGNGMISQLDDVLNEIEAEKCVLVSSKSFSEKCNKLMEENEKIKAVYSSVHPNPLLSDCEKIVELIKANGADTVIALGGGSSIDASKFAAACAYSEISPKEHYLSPAFPGKTAKIVAVPTTSGTGSEVKTLLGSRAGPSREVPSGSHCY